MTENREYDKEKSEHDRERDRHDRERENGPGGEETLAMTWKYVAVVGGKC